MTVRENLDLGAYLRRDDDGIAADLDRVFELFPRLKERERQKAGTMSGGEQQMLAIGRALMAQPKLLLLDEPSMGIAPILVERIYETIARDQPAGHDDPAGRAERQLRARRRPSAATCSRPAQVALRDDSDGAARRPRGPEGVPGRMTVFAVIGAKALYLLFVWLVSAIVRPAVGAQGLRRAPWARVRPAAVRRRGADRPPASRAARLALEGGWACRGGTSHQGSRRSGMNLLVALAIVVAAAGVAALLMVAVRRRVPGAVLREPARGTPMLTMLGTAFAVLLAFITLAAFQTYNGAKSGAASEADAVLEMFRTAEFFPTDERNELRSDLVCYGRSVVSAEWPAMGDGHSSPQVDVWIAAYRDLFARLDLASARARLGFQEVLQEARARTDGRQQRLEEASPSVPTPLWLVLVLGGVVAIVLQLAMADRRSGSRSSAG